MVGLGMKNVEERGGDGRSVGVDGWEGGRFVAGEVVEADLGKGSEDRIGIEGGTTGVGTGLF